MSSRQREEVRLDAIARPARDQGRGDHVAGDCPRISHRNCRANLAQMCLEGAAR